MDRENEQKRNLDIFIGNFAQNALRNRGIYGELRRGTRLDSGSQTERLFSFAASRSSPQERKERKERKEEERTGRDRIEISRVPGYKRRIVMEEIRFESREFHCTVH